VLLCVQSKELVPRAIRRFEPTPQDRVYAAEFFTTRMLIIKACVSRLQHNRGLVKAKAVCTHVIASTFLVPAFDAGFISVLIEALLTSSAIEDDTSSLLSAVFMLRAQLRVSVRLSCEVCAVVLHPAP
jgi:uncharacterized membrane protein